jgi:hypothetical protein
MPYIRRKNDGSIEAVFDTPQTDAGEELPATAPELISFLCSSDEAQWLSSDLALMRVLEDLIVVLMSKDVISFSDLPPAAQEKLISRRGMRMELDKELGYMASMFEEEQEEIDF